MTYSKRPVGYAFAMAESGAGIWRSGLCNMCIHQAVIGGPK